LQFKIVHELIRHPIVPAFTSMSGQACPDKAYLDKFVRTCLSAQACPDILTCPDKHVGQAYTDMLVGIRPIRPMRFLLNFKEFFTIIGFHVTLDEDLIVNKFKYKNRRNENTLPPTKIL